MEKKRKTDLFRFVTLRSPETITTTRKNLGFFEHIDLPTSHFLQHIGSPTFDADIAEALTSFTPMTKLSDVIAVSPQWWEFAQWLSQNKSTVDKASAESKMPPLPGLSADELMPLWDNVYCSILTRSNHAVRQACLQLLIGANFREKYVFFLADDPLNAEQKAQETSDMRRLANAKVLIHKALAPKKTEFVAEPAAPSSKRTAKQETRHRAKLAAQQVTLFKKLEKELGCLEKHYINHYNAALLEASEAYDNANKDIIANYIKRMGSEIKGELEYSLPDNLVPNFSFSYQLPLSDEYLLANASADLRTYVQSNCLSTETIQGAIEKVRTDIAALQKTAARSAKKQFNTMLVNGVLTRPNSSQPKEFSLSFKKVSDDGEVVTYSILLLLDTGYNGGFFTTSSFRFKMGGVTHETTTPLIHSSADNSIFAELFQGAPLTIGAGNVFTIEADFTLDNGKSYSINRVGALSSSVLSGLATVSFSESEVDFHYGINRLGIADYRRVEQELCCYIPGEVSHIENVMAREYKERSTRNLTSTELTTESTSEREMEELSDTTSTTRHELSTEIASVIERDRQQSLGFSAHTNGDYGKIEFGAEAHGDFTFGQSTSDSNSTAQTYAEDVTRRALERIVHKTTLKRTSKMIREFEENNRHGFDNREGEQHVTGIYRWVDKVYKNRIFNYGKRLIYEFMVPEPARFYKDAIIVQAEEEDVPADAGSGSSGSATVAVKPTHPSEYGMNDAASLTRDNYTTIASMYGVSVVAPENEYSNVTDSYAQSIGSTDQDKAFSYNTLNVPGNYQCYQIVGTVNYNYKARVGANAYIKINVGGKNWERTGISGEGSASNSFSHAMSNVEGMLPTTFNTKKITSFNASIEAKCRLKSSIFEQWQQDTYETIMRAYEDQLRAFNEAQELAEAASAAAAAGNEAEAESGRNPLFNAEIVKTELKRLCIEMLTKPFGIEQGRDFYQEGACKVPELILTEDLDVYSSRVKFFEQAFDWDLMAQKFYPYYWAKRCDWKTLFQATDGNDFLFQAFLQSGMGRVVVPVRQGFEDAVIFFMETGEVWNGTGMVIDIDDSLYVDIVEEFTTEPGYVDGVEWETVVPSTLTILQARSALLDEEGLPCCEEPEVGEPENPIKPDTNILELLTDEPEV